MTTPEFVDPFEDDTDDYDVFCCPECDYGYYGDDEEDDDDDTE